MKLVQLLVLNDRTFFATYLSWSCFEALYLFHSAWESHSELHKFSFFSAKQHFLKTFLLEKNHLKTCEKVYLPFTWICNGQIISKWFLVSSDSSKKRTNEFVFWPNSIKNEFVRLFFGRIRGYQKVFSKLSDL